RNSLHLRRAVRRDALESPISSLEPGLAAPDPPALILHRPVALRDERPLRTPSRPDDVTSAHARLALSLRREPARSVPRARAHLSFIPFLPGAAGQRRTTSRLARERRSRGHRGSTTPRGLR